MKTSREHSEGFDSPAINREYLRWWKKIGAEKTDADADITLSAREVLRAHFLVADFFANEKGGLGGLGPRDKNGDLLLSALSRQDTGFGGERKWTSNFHIAATVFFGLIKNHPFHDGNKRTALLSVLHLLEKQKYTASVKKRDFEDLTVAVADGLHHTDNLYLDFRSTSADANDADVKYIAFKLGEFTRPRDRSRRKLKTYRELNGVLKRHGYEMRHPRGNKIAIVRIADEKTIGRVGFPGMSREISKPDLKQVRDICQLSDTDGYDNKAFYNGAGGMDFLLSEYAAPLRRLADK